MKKVLLIVAFLLLSVSAAAAEREMFRFENPGILIITHPEERFRTTTSARMSILGAADPSEPLYINGALTPVTVRGFFAAYMDLELGDNVFTFVNGINAQTITITREAATPWTPTQTVYYSMRIYGSTEHNYISRFANLDDDLYMKTPLARLTTFRIIAEHGDFYILEDNTAVFKSNVYQLDYIPEALVISDESFTEHERGADAVLIVNVYPLYEVELDGNSARLILHSKDSVITRDYTFSEPVTGFNVSFSQGSMNIHFRYAPPSLSEAVVLLDAGHGGGDPGALGPPSEFAPMEKDFNLYVARVARDYLEALGVTVLFIREDDRRIDIFDRVAFFGENPDIAVSVHANSMPLSADFTSARGPLMFYTVDLSHDAAAEMLRIIAAETGNTYVPPKRQNFAMARYTGAPSMLFEMGFLCNPEEYEVMLDADYLDKMGLALGRAIAEQFTMHDAQFTIDDEPVPQTAPQTSPIITAATEEAIPAAAQPEPPHADLNRGINIFAAITIGMIFAGAALFLPNRESLMKRK
jgi:N-acetylmuramoyl-L-alanine amidase